MPVSEITILRILHNYKPLLYGIWQYWRLITDSKYETSLGITILHSLQYWMFNFFGNISNGVWYYAGNIVISETVQLFKQKIVGLRYYTDYNIPCAIVSEKSIPVSEITILHNYKPFLYEIWQYFSEMFQTVSDITILRYYDIMLYRNTKRCFIRIYIQLTYIFFWKNWNLHVIL